MQNKEILIRPMRTEDVPAISKLEEAAFSMPWSAQDFLDMVDREGSLYVTALAGSEVIGCCGVTNACGDGDINNVVVAEGWRNVSLASLGQVNRVEFTYDGSDKGAYGLNTPQYFAFDDVVVN